MVPIAKLNCFVILPAVFAAIGASPAVYYARILEGHAWRGYLKRKTCLIGKEKLAIYQWRNEENKAVGPKTPFRIHLDLSDTVRLANIPNLILLTFVVAFISFAGAFLAERAGIIFPHLETFIVNEIRPHVPTLTFTAVILFAYKIIMNWEKPRDISLKINTIINRLERILYSRAG